MAPLQEGSCSMMLLHPQSAGASPPQLLQMWTAQPQQFAAEVDASPPAVPYTWFDAAITATC
jgi:hypothetical protein